MNAPFREEIRYSTLNPWSQIIDVVGGSKAAAKAQNTNGVQFWQFLDLKEDLLQLFKVRLRVVAQEHAQEK